MHGPTGVARASFPLSTAQLPLWLIDSRAGNHAQQVEGCLLHVRGEVDAGRLREVIARTTQRHPALRIGYEAAAGQPCQRVHGAVGWTLAEADFSAMPPEVAHAEAARWRAELGSARFDLSSPPLWRAGVARLPGGESLIAVAAHHLICDGWTLRLLFDEVSEEYRTGLPPPAEPSSAASYPGCLLDRDDEWRKDSRTIAYWRSVLDDCEAPRVVVPGGAPAADPDGPAVRASVCADVSRLIRGVARRHRVTAFLVFAAVYAITIAWFSGASRIPVASAFHGRTRPEFKRVAGLFATMLVLRADLTGDPSFSELLARMRQTYRDCLANQNITLEELALERKLSREPFFRHVISYHPASFALSGFARMPAAMDLVSVKPAPNELEFHVRELADSFALQLRFNPGVLDAGSARTVLDVFGQLLASLAADPGRSVVSVQAVG